MSVVPYDSKTSEQNKRDYVSSRSSSSIDGGKRVKRFGIKEITPEMVHDARLKVESLALSQSWYDYLFKADPSLAHDRQKYNISKKEYRTLRDDYAKQQTRLGKGCEGYLPDSIEPLCGRIRKHFLATCEHPRFDQFIMVCILVNCVFLALADPSHAEEPPYQLIAGYIFLAIFTVECLYKLIALSSLYFHDYWNWLDVVVVIEGWVSFITAGGGFLSGLKTLRILRPLRVANRLPSLKKVITALLGSLPAIFNTFIVFFFFLLIFAMLCVMLWNGTFHFRCRDNVSGEWVDEETLCYPAPLEATAVFCRSLQFLDSPYICESGETCENYGSTPEDGDLNFDNLGYSLLTLFTVSTMEGWVDVLFYTQNVMTQGTFFVFLGIILIGNFTIVNLMIAAILVQLDGAAELEEREAVAAELAAAEEEEYARLEAIENHELAVRNAQLDAQRKIDNGEKNVVVMRPPPLDATGHLKKNKKRNLWIDKVLLVLARFFKKTCYKGLPKNKGADHWTTKLRWVFLDDASPFSNFIQGCILFNLGVLAMDSHGIPSSTNRFLSRANLTLTGIFCFEMAAKLYVGGVIEYVSSKWNLFDGFIVTGSVLELVMASGASSLGALRVVRMLRLTRVARLARLANKWKSLQDVLSLMVKSSSGMGPVLLLLILFMFIFSILGMQMFGASVTTDDYIRFDSFLVAFVQCFFVIIGEAWVQIMYVTMADTNPVSSIYFVLLIVVGSFILINLILAVVLGDSMPNKIQMEVGIKQIDIILNGFSLRCAIQKWKWFTHGYRIQEVRTTCLAQWRQSREKHGSLIFEYGLLIGVGDHLIDEIQYYIDLPDPPLHDPVVYAKPEEGEEAVSMIRQRSGSLIRAVKRVASFNNPSPSSSQPSSRPGSASPNNRQNADATITSSGDQLLLCHHTHSFAEADEEQESSPKRISSTSQDLESKGGEAVGNESKESKLEYAEVEIKGGGPGVEMTDMTFTSVNIDAELESEEGKEEEGGEDEEEALRLIKSESDDVEEDEYYEILEYDESTWEAIEEALLCIESLIEKLNNHPKFENEKQLAKTSSLDESTAMALIGPGALNDYKEQTYELFSNCTNGFTLRQKIELGIISAHSGEALRHIADYDALFDEEGDSEHHHHRNSGHHRSSRGSIDAGSKVGRSSRGSIDTGSKVGRSSRGSIDAGSKAGRSSRGSIDTGSKAGRSSRGSMDAGSKVGRSSRGSIDSGSAPLKRASAGSTSRKGLPRRNSAFASHPLKKQPSFLEQQAAASALMRTPSMKEKEKGGRRNSLDVISPPIPRTASDARAMLMGWRPSERSMQESDFDEDRKEDKKEESQEEEEKDEEKEHEEIEKETLKKSPTSTLMRKISFLSPSFKEDEENKLVGQHVFHGFGHRNGNGVNRNSDHCLPRDGDVGSFDSAAGRGRRSSPTSPTSRGSIMDRYNKHLTLLNDAIIETKWERRWKEYREFCKNLASKNEWRDVILCAIVLSSCLMLFTDENTPYMSIWFILDMICAFIFIVEVAVMIGAAEGKPRPLKYGIRTGVFVYLENPWNRLDVSIVVVTLLGPIFAETNITWAYGICTVVRSFRPLRIINRVDSLKYTVATLYMSLVRLGTLILFLGFSMTAYAVVGMQLLKGLYYYCDDGDFAENDVYLETVGPFPENSFRYGKTVGGDGFDKDYYTARPCNGIYTNTNGTQLEAMGKWRNPTFHFDDFANSFLSVFVLSTEGWAEIVWYGLSATEVDYSSKPYFNDNLLVLFYFFFGVAFFGLYMLNLFIGVVFDQYNEMKAIKDDGKVLKKEEREWEEYRERLVFVKPIRCLPNPQARWRVWCEKVATSPLFNRLVLTVIGLNAVTLAVTHRGQSDGYTSVLEWSNVCFAFVFFVEFFVKVAGHGVRNYVANSVDDFDAVVTLVSIVDSLLFVTKSCTDSDSAFLRFVRSMRVFRLMRLVNLIPGCEDIILACRFALPRLVNVCLLLLILVFFFANVGVVFFGHIPNTYSGEYASFQTVSSSMQLLFVIMTGDAWTDFLGDMLEEAPELKVQIVIFFLFYLVVQYFVVVNLFVMVVVEAFEVLSEDNRKKVEKLLPRFQECWAKLDPHATGRIKATEVESLIRLVPDPFGVSYPDDVSQYQKSYRKVRAKADFLRMQQLGHTGGDIKADETVKFTGVLSGIIAVWLNEVGEIKMKGVQEQVQLLAASFLITARAKAWADRTRKHLFQKKVAKLNINIDLLPPNAHLMLADVAPNGRRSMTSRLNAINFPMKHNKVHAQPPPGTTSKLTTLPSQRSGSISANVRSSLNSLSPAKFLFPRQSKTAVVAPEESVAVSPPSESLSLKSDSTMSPAADTSTSQSSSPADTTTASPQPKSLIGEKLDISSIEASSVSSSKDVTPPLTPNRPDGTPPTLRSDKMVEQSQATIAAASSLEQSPSSPAANTLSKSTDLSLTSSPNRRTSDQLNQLKHTNGGKKKSVGDEKMLYNEDNLPSGWAVKISKLYHTQFYFHAESSTSSWYHPLDPRFTQAKKRGSQEQ